MPLLDFQRSNIQKFKEDLLTSHSLQIIGKQGSGRRYAIQSLSNEYFVITISNPEHDNGLIPIINALIKFKQYLSKFTVHFNLGISIQWAFLGMDINSNEINAEETKLVNVVKKLRKKRPVIILVDYNELSETITRFIKSVTEQNGKNAIYSVYLTNDEIRILNAKPLHFDNLDNSITSRRDILKSLELADWIKLTDDEVDFIFNLTKNSITELNEIILNLNNSKLSFTACRDEQHSIIGLLNQCFDDATQKKSIDRILTYCSYSDDFNLSKSDLKFLLNMNLPDIDNCIINALNNKLLGVNNDKVYIIISLLKTVYKEQFQSRSGEIYGRLCDMIAEMYPSNYKQKYLYAKYANDKNADIYFCQYCMQEMRLKGVSIDYLDVQGYRFTNLLNDYKEALHYANIRQYEKTIEILSSGSDLPSPLEAEIKLIICQARMKSLESSERMCAINTIKTVKTDKLDGNLKYRICMFKVVAEIHLGLYADAFINYSYLKNEIFSKLDNNASCELAYIYYTLLRKSNMVNNYQSAVIDMEKACDYFFERRDLPVPYYLSIINCLGIHIKNMKLDEAQKDIERFEQLEKSNIYLNFPRFYLYENNYYLYEYFSDKADASKTCVRFNNLYKSMTDNADRVLIANNYAVFLALSGHIAQALSLLEEVCDRIEEDNEGIYFYKTKLNMSIMRYIINNSERDKLIKEISKIKFDDSYPNKTVMRREIELTINAMSKECNSVNEYMENYNKLLPEYRPKNGFEVGFVITELFSWDDD